MVQAGPLLFSVYGQLYLHGLPVNNVLNVLCSLLSERQCVQYGVVKREWFSPYLPLHYTF